jgi:oligoribonuclease
MDKLFLQRYMPQVAEHLHYRIVDVSSVKEV